MNNCLNPNDKHLLSWISRRAADGLPGLPGLPRQRPEAQALPPRQCETQRRMTKKKYCEWQREQKKKKKLCVFLSPSTFPPPPPHHLGPELAKRFKFNRQSVWSAAAAAGSGYGIRDRDWDRWGNWRVCLLRSLRSINLHTIWIAKPQVRQLFLPYSLDFYLSFFSTPSSPFSLPGIDMQRQKANFK